jgi:hypothetical protein
MLKSSSDDSTENVPPPPCDRVAVMESADKMTDRQIAAKARQYFAAEKMEE